MHKRVFSNPVNPETISNSNSWEECSASCKAKDSCLNWEWRGQGHSSPNTCVLNEGFTKTMDNYYTIAGNRECQGGIRLKKLLLRFLSSAPEEDGWVTCQDDDPFSGLSSFWKSEVKHYFVISLD